MAGNKKPRKKYCPRWNGGNVKLRSEPWKVVAVFTPLENILDELESEGTVSALPDGTPIFQDTNDGAWYPMAPALNGVIDAYEIHQKRTGRELPLDVLRRLAKKLEVAMPLFQADTKSARAALAALKAETMQMSAAYAKSLVRAVQISVAFDERKMKEAV